MTYIEVATEAFRVALLPALAKAGMKWNPDDVPQLRDLYVLLVLTVGEDVTLEDVHDAWAIYTQTARPGHPDLIPFLRLTPGVADYDAPFREAIREAARALRRR